MIQRIEDVIKSEHLIQVLLALNHYSMEQLGGKPWLEIVHEEGSERYQVVPKMPELFESLLRKGIATGADWLGLLAGAMWLRAPRMARPTPEQAESFQNIAIELEVTDFSAPFPAMVIETPGCDPFESVIVYHADNILVLHLSSKNMEDDIVTTVRHVPGRAIEVAINILDDTCDPSLAEESLRAQRIALNMCLALTNYGFKDADANPANASQDRMLARENSERGERARARIRRGVLRRVTFNHDIVIRRTPPTEGGGANGRTVKAHWVRGHWKMQPHGPHNSLRKRILIRPYLVHGDQAAGLHPGLVVYHDHR